MTRVNTKAPLLPHQREALSWLEGKTSAGLFYSMGLGKSRIAIEHLSDERLPALVVAPKRVAEYVWPIEVAKWSPGLSVAVARGNKSERRKALDSNADVVAISRDNLGDLGPVDAKRFRSLIIDELSSFKTPSSKRTRILKMFIQDMSKRQVLGLTGTPASNGLLDLWSQVFLLDGGQRLGRTYSGYRARYFRPSGVLPNGVRYGYKPVEGAAEAIHTAIADLCLSARAGTYLADLLPEVTVNEVVVPLPKAARRLYDQMRRDMYASLPLLGETITAETAASLSNKLQQVSAGFLYAPGGESWEGLHTAKLDALDEVLEGSGGSPVLVAYHYRAELAALRKRYPGAMAATDPNALEAWDAGDVGMMLAHPASVGHGLNLQFGGHVAAWTTPQWSLELNDQVNARLARLGQSRGVVIHYLLAEGTVDAAILRRLESKASVQDALLGHLEQA